MKIQTKLLNLETIFNTADDICLSTLNWPNINHNNDSIMNLIEHILQYYASEKSPTMTVIQDEITLRKLSKIGFKCYSVHFRDLFTQIECDSCTVIAFQMLLLSTICKCLHSYCHDFTAVQWQQKMLQFNTFSIEFCLYADV